MRRTVLLATIMLGAAGCGARTHAVLRTEAVLHAHVVSTVQPGNRRFSDSYATGAGPDGAANCRTAANDGNASTPMFVVGAPGSKRAPLYFGMQTRAFTGPGVYTGDRVRLDSVVAIIDRKPVGFARAATSAVSVRVASDASGTASLHGFRSTDGRTITATVTWTCTTETVAFPVDS